MEIAEPVRRKALARGPAGEEWLASLPGVVDDLAREWGLTIGEMLPGGTEAFVAEATTADGRAAVLKVCIPESDPDGHELGVLLAAGGRGYAAVYRHDRFRGAMLVERLGPRLAMLGWPVDAQIVALCRTLTEAWAPASGETGFATGAEKAERLAAFIEGTWLELGRPGPPRTIATALRYADERRRGFDPATAVLAHGDAHAGNALLVPDGSGRFKFVDPDGLLIERAYDLGISMREWTSDLLAGDPVARGLRRCRRLARLSGVDPEPIWQWGYVERVSTALLCAKVGLAGAGDMLDVAAAWSEDRPG